MTTRLTTRGADAVPVHPMGGRARILLTSVFGPYAQDDEFGSRFINPMELYHNQVMRTQGVFSLRMFHRSWGLMLIQAHIEAPAALLDFPSLDRFVEEIDRHDYDIVGISAIWPNLDKVAKMCALLREHLPQATIVVGGQVANLPGLRERIDADHVVRGDGVAWFRLRAFRRDFEVNGPSVLRIARTLFRGWMRYKHHPDARIRARFRRECRGLRTAYAGGLWAAERWLAGNGTLTRRLCAVRHAFDAEFGLTSRIAAPVVGRVVLSRMRREQRRLDIRATYVLRGEPGRGHATPTGEALPLGLSRPADRRSGTVVGTDVRVAAAEVGRQPGDRGACLFRDRVRDTTPRVAVRGPPSARLAT